VARAEDLQAPYRKISRTAPPLTALELLYGFISPFAKMNSGKYVDNPRCNNKVARGQTAIEQNVGQKNGA
jgi:hypothetical protein